MADSPTAEEIAILLGRELTDAEAAAVPMYIEFAEGEIETWLDRPIHPTSFTENAFPDANGTVYLKNTPVISIESITINGESKVPGYFTVTPYGLEDIYSMSWSYLPFDLNHPDTDYIYGPSLVVEYTAGLDYPMAIKSIVAQAVKECLYDDMTKTTQASYGAVGVKQISVEDFTVIYQSQSGLSSLSNMFNPDVDFKNIKRLKKRRWG